MINKNSILKKLYSLHRYGIKLGLERTLYLLEKSGSPHLHFPSIHIAGTNGKGTTASAIASILQEAGYKTGLYTSPHIWQFNERIRINGIKISDDDLVEIADFYLKIAEGSESTFFEITTAIAFKHFAENKVDIAVIETGMGGRFDSTNVLKPLLSVITGIDFDHEEFLGTTLEEIALEKAGIIKPSTPAIINESRHHLRQVFKDKADSVSAMCVFVDNSRILQEEFLPDVSMKCCMNTASGVIKDLEFPLAGKHQSANLATIFTTIDILSQDYIIKETAIRAGLSKIIENTGLRCRIDPVSKEPLIVVDVAHNPDGIRRTIETLTMCFGSNQEWNIVFGAMSDKAIEAMLAEMKSLCKKLIPVSLQTERAAAAAEITAAAVSHGISVAEPSTPAVEFEKALGSSEKTLIIGSFYLAAELPEGKITAELCNRIRINKKIN